MQVIFESRSRDATNLRQLADERVRFVLRRLSWLVPRARVQFVDINGPRGGVDKRCRLVLNTDGAGQVIIHSTARDWRCALERVLVSAARGLMRNWRRRQRFGHDRKRIATQRESEYGGTS